jgi:hypothetical protein
MMHIYAEMAFETSKLASRDETRLFKVDSI